jgi:Phosphoesterase family
VSRRRLTLLAALSFTATGVVIGAGLHRHDSSALAGYALARVQEARTVPPAATTVTTTTTTTESAPAPVADDPTTSSSDSVDTTPVASTDESSTTTTTTTTTSTPAVTSKVGHVFVVELPSAGYDATFGGTSPEGRLLTNYSAVGPGELPSYIALISGQPPNADTEAGCATYADFPSSAKPDTKTGVVPGDGCVYPVEALTLADQLTGKGLTWKAYIDGMTAACQHPDSGAADTQAPGSDYATRHNPFVYFHSLLDLGDCATNDLPLASVTADLATTKKTPSFSFIAPGLSAADPARADAFLSQWVPAILASPAYKKDGLVAITFSAPAAGGPAGTLLLSPFLKAGSQDSTAYDTYSLLRTVEDVFGLDHLAKAGGKKVKRFGGGLLSGS